MYPATVADELRTRGHDVVSSHDAALRHFEGAFDEDVFTAALVERRVLVTENVSDFRRLEGDALARGGPTPGLVLTTNRHVAIPPRSDGSSLLSMPCSRDSPSSREPSSSRRHPPPERPEGGCVPDLVYKATDAGSSCRGPARTRGSPRLRCRPWRRDIDRRGWSWLLVPVRPRRVSRPAHPRSR